MKVDDSGMPEEAYWNSLFDIEAIVDWLDLPKINIATIAEIGCGYGTFTGFCRIKFSSLNQLC